MLEVDDILPWALTPFVLAPRVPEPVSEMQTLALFTMAQTSLHQQSVDAAKYARVNPLPSPATSSSSSGKFHLYINSETGLPFVPTAQRSSSQELQAPSQVPQLPHAQLHTAVSTQQPPQPTNIQSWADEVATAEQSGHYTPKAVVPNWAYSGRIRGAEPKSQPLFYRAPVRPTPLTQRPPLLSPIITPARTRHPGGVQRRQNMKFV